MNTADGALNSLEFQVVGVFQTFSKDYDARAVRIPLTAAQEMLATTGVNTLVVSLKQTEDSDAMAAALADRHGRDGLEVKTWLQLNDFYAKTVEMYDAQFAVLRIIILLMVLLSVANSVNHERIRARRRVRHHDGPGQSQRTDILLIIAENTIIGLIGAGAGVVLESYWR